MDRLTEKDNKYNLTISNDKSSCLYKIKDKSICNIMSSVEGKIVDLSDNKFLAIQKLGKYEDIDEKLGLPYPVFFEAYFNGVYYLDDSGQIIKTTVDIYDLYLTERKEIAFITKFGNRILLFEDYGKTWVLTKEGLEDGTHNNR